MHHRGCLGTKPACGWGHHGEVRVAPAEQLSADQGLEGVKRKETKRKKWICPCCCQTEGRDFAGAWGGDFGVRQKKLQENESGGDLQDPSAQPCRSPPSSTQTPNPLSNNREEKTLSWLHPHGESKEFLPAAANPSPSPKYRSAPNPGATPRTPKPRGVYLSAG